MYLHNIQKCQNQPVSFVMMSFSSCSRIISHMAFTDQLIGSRSSEIWEGEEFRQEKTDRKWKEQQKTNRSTHRGSDKKNYAKHLNPNLVAISGKVKKTSMKLTRWTSHTHLIFLALPLTSGTFFLNSRLSSTSAYGSPRSLPVGLLVVPPLNLAPSTETKRKRERRFREACQHSYT